MFRRWFRVKSWRDDEYLKEVQSKSLKAKADKSIGEKVRVAWEDGVEQVEQAAKQVKDTVADTQSAKELVEAVKKVASKVDQAIYQHEPDK